MCGGGSASKSAESAQYQAQFEPYQHPPEHRISDAFRKELGVTINPQALRIFIRKEWKLLAKAAHEIHDA